MMLRFANPGAWLFAGLLAVLIALHLRERTRRRVDVPSLLLWRTLPAAPTRAARLRPNWLLALQCVALLALVASLADPHRDADPSGAGSTRTVFVLDMSASMQAHEGRESRFAQARRAVRDRIEALPSNAEVMLVTAGHQPAVAVAPTTDHAETLRRLAALEPVDTAADLDAALSLARRAAERGDRATRIELHTDTPPARLAAPWRDAVSVFPVGETDDNLAIADVQVFQGRFDDPAAAHAFVAVRNFARREAHGVLTLHLDDTIIGRQGFTLAPRSVGGFPIRQLPGPGVLRASLEVDDALAVDNLGYALVRAQPPIRVLAVTDDTSLRADLQRIAAATHGLVVTVVASDAYRGGAGADVVLFHRVAPPLPTDAAALYLAPSDVRGPFPPLGEAHEVPVVDWMQEHPILHGIKPDFPFRVAEARILAAPAWADSVLLSRTDTQDIPLVLAGTADGWRRAVMAFDPVADGLLRAERVDILVLLLNLLDWLAPADDDVRVVPTGSIEVIEGLADLPRRVFDPRGGERRLEATDAAVVDTPFVGAYRIEADGTAVRLYAALRDAEESDIGRPATAPRLADAAPAARAPQTPARGGAGGTLATVAAALLIGEWFFARRQA